MAKKSFTTPESAFINIPSSKVLKKKKTAKNKAAAIQEAPEGYELIKERKTEKILILIRPTTHKKLKAEAEKLKISKNELITRCLEDYLAGATK